MESGSSSLPGDVQLTSSFGRHIPQRHILAQLQRPDIRDDRPSVPHVDLSRIVRHGAKTVGYHIKEMTDASLFQAIDVERRRLPESPLDHHPFAVSEPPVTDRAKDIEPFASSVQNLACDRKRERIDKNGALGRNRRLRVDARRFPERKSPGIAVVWLALPVYRCKSSLRCPRATVPGKMGRADSESSKKVLPLRGLYFG